MHTNVFNSFLSYQFPGMRAIYQTLFGIYRDQGNPLVISTVQKIWQQFPSTNEPLDYIFIYYNKGSLEENVSPHWHYISLGLSDLYGDSRIHPIDPSESTDRSSGFGFELTLRLKKNAEISPPSWPAQLMQQLARYVFLSKNKLLPSDYINWNQPLNGEEGCKIKQILITLDCQLKRITTVLGHVSFCQIVGVTDEEVSADKR
jgi:suppressor of fused